MKNTFVCPYCFAEPKIEDIEFRCVNTRDKDVDDVPLTRYEHGDEAHPLKRKPTFRPAKSFAVAQHAFCPQCGMKSGVVVCPACHNKLPESTLNGDDMIISVVGSRGTGKSHFVAVLINELRQRVAPRIGGSMSGFDTTWDRYTNGPYKSLYQNMKKLQLTQSSEVNINNDAYRPYIFTLQLKEKKLFKEINKNITLVFFDTAGEDMNNFATMSTVNKYICKSQGIIFLLDPMQIPGVRNLLDDDTIERACAVDWSKVSAADDVMSRVSELIRTDKGMGMNDKIKIPVAAVFSKFDAVASLVPEGSNVLEVSPHCKSGGYSESDGNAVNMEIQGLLDAWGENAFRAQLDSNYTKYQFFTTSALGLNNNPKKDESIERPRPHRIEDAMMWILKENGVIKGTK